MEQIVILVGIVFLTITGLMFRRYVLPAKVQRSSAEELATATLLNDPILDLLPDEGLFGSSKTEDTDNLNPTEEKEVLLEDKLDAKELVSHLKESGYVLTDFTDLQIDILENTKILDKYDDWSYADVYTSGKILLFFPKVVVPAERRSTHYTEFRLMFWTKIDNYTGRYYFWEKASGDRYYDRIRTNDDIKLANYDSLTLCEGGNHDAIKKVVDLLDKESGLEIEVEDDDLFVKTFKSPNLEDFKRIESILKTIK